MNDLEQKLFEATVQYYVLTVIFKLLDEQDEGYTRESAAEDLTNFLKLIGLD